MFKSSIKIYENIYEFNFKKLVTKNVILPLHTPIYQKPTNQTSQKHQLISKPPSMTTTTTRSLGKNRKRTGVV